MVLEDQPMLTVGVMLLWHRRRRRAQGRQKDRDVVGYVASLVRYCTKRLRTMVEIPDGRG